jgi:SulP family sulfate permease
MVEEARSAGRTLLIAGANQALEQRLRQFGVEGVLRPSRLNALREAAQLI